MQKVTDSSSRISNKLKQVYQKIKHPKGYKGLIAIFGAQRSGTTLLSKLLSESWDSRVFGEFSELSNNDMEHGIRLNNMGSVKKTLSLVNSPLVILKPLVESQSAKQIISNLDRSVGVWQYRHYQEVAISDNIQFPNTSGTGNIKSILDGEESCWRAEGLTEDTVKTVKEMSDLGLSKYESACLFWWVRNTLCFDQGIHESSDFVLLNYRSFVMNPSLALEKIYIFAGVTTRSKDSTYMVGKNEKIGMENNKIHPVLKKLCDDMYEKLTSSKNNI